jgi:LytS/YehU family sensor histidine kinase
MIVNNLWLTPYVIVVNFVLFEFSLIFLSVRTLHWFFLLVILHIILYPFVFYQWRELGLLLNIYKQVAEMTYYARLESLMTYAVGSIFFFGLCKHIYTHLKLRRDALQLRIEKQQAELNYLKSQTNPHFLFNTLNNIYSLSSEKSDLAPESILRLSKILRYMLYETGGPSVSIEQELQTINNYLELERLRYDESLGISFQQDIEDKSQSISPLLLIPLIENAFKHGTSETITRPFVRIQLTIHEQQLTLIVENSSDPDTEDVPKESIGLTNLRRQLSLLYRDSSLEIQKTTKTFVASLKINLTSHV